MGKQFSAFDVGGYATPTTARPVFNFNAFVGPQKPVPAPAPVVDPNLLRRGQYVGINVSIDCATDKDKHLIAYAPQNGMRVGPAIQPKESTLNAESWAKVKNDRRLVGVYVGDNPGDPAKAYAYLSAREIKMPWKGFQPS